MNNLLQYLAESSLALLLFYLLYVLLLSRQTCFKFNRFYLLASLLFSFTIPFLELPAWRPAEPELQTDITFIQVQSPDIVYQIPVIQAAPVETINYGVWLYGIYVSGLIIAGILFCRHFLKLYTFIYSHSAEGYYWQKIKIIPTNGEISTFSFFKYILFDNSQPFTLAEKELILRHEQAHLAQKHTYDILYIKLLTIIFWFNPLLYLYKKALESTHEYLADAQVLQEEDSEAYAALLVQQVFHKTGFSLVNFFHIHRSLTLKRLAMMKKIKPTSAFIRPLLALPVVCAVALVFASNQSVTLPEMKTFTSTTNKLTGISGFSSEDKDNNYTHPIANADASDEISEPAFQNGNDQLYRFLLQNLKFKPEAFGKDAIRRAVVSIIIDAEGNPKTTSAENGDLINQEINRVIGLMPRWIPAYRDGKGLPSRYELHFLIDRKSKHSAITLKKNVTAHLFDSEGLPLFKSDIIHLGLNPVNGRPANFLDRDPIVAGDITEPSFPGGKAAMERYFKENVNLAKIAEKIPADEKGFALGSGIRIKIDRNGNIAKLSPDNRFSNLNYRYTNALGNNLTSELISLVNKMPPWEPAKKDGKNIDSEFSLNYALLYPSEPVKPQRRTQIYSINPKGEIIFESDKIYFLIPAKPSLIKKDKANNKILSGTNLPQFPGGKAALQDFLKQNTKYPASALKSKITGQAIIQATIDEEGNVKNFKTLQADNDYFEQEALSVVKNMPRWIPGSKDGKPASYNMAFPFVFGLENAKNRPAIKLPAKNTSQLYLADAVTIMGYSQVVAGKTVIKKSVSPVNKNYQINSGAVNNKTKGPVVKQPVFPGGPQALQKYLSNIKYPSEAKSNNTVANLVVQIRINEKGHIDDYIYQLDGNHINLNQIDQIFRREMPAWQPGTVDGKPTPFYYLFPIKFYINAGNGDLIKPSEALMPQMIKRIVNQNDGQTIVAKEITVFAYQNLSEAPKTLPKPVKKEAENLPANENSQDDKIFTFVEQVASFPGGFEAMNKFMKENLKYPEAAKQNKEQGLVVVQFVVSKTGKISDPKVVKSLGKEFDEEAIRVVNQMPDFTPAKQNGIPVNFNYTLPIRFGL